MTDQEPTKLNEQEIKILEFCKEPHSKKEIMKYMEYKHARNFTILYLKPLLEKGLLQMTIPEKPNHKNQKYITRQGKINMVRIAITTGGVKQSLSNYNA